MDPPITDVGKQYRLFFILSDLNAISPLSSVYEVQVFVIQPVNQPNYEIKDELVVKK